MFVSKVSSKTWKIYITAMLTVFLLLFVIGLKAIYNVSFSAKSTIFTIVIPLNFVIMALCYIMLFSMYLIGSNRNIDRQFMQIIIWCFLYAFFDIISWSIYGVARYRILSILSNTIYYIGSVYLCLNFWLFIRIWFSRDAKDIITSDIVVLAVGAVSLIAIALNLVFGYYFTVDALGIYTRSSTYYLSLIGPAVILLISIIYILSQKQKFTDKIIMLLYPLMPFLSATLTISTVSPALTNILVFCAIFMLYNHLFVRLEHERIIQEAKLMQTTSELTQARINLLVSQIHPHFVSNTLGMIRSLYRKDPVKAEISMNTFIRYLQNNFSELSRTSPIPFSHELEHIKQFIELQQMRWPDISAEYDIRCRSFMLPALTLQPLVENSIRHGLMPLKTGGTVTISSWETDTEYIVSVKDNGVGFDTAELEKTQPNDREHIGTENIRSRLETMCSGTLTIESTPGKGTEALVRIPKSGGVNNESNMC